MNITISNEIIKDILEEYMLEGMIGILINYPELGEDNTPTEEEYRKRKELDMIGAVVREVELDGGYRRSIIKKEEVEIGKDYESIKVKLRFKAEEGKIGPFTHVVLIRGGNIVGGNIENGNNRGDIRGTVILSKPKIGTEYIEAPEEYKVEIPLVVIGRGIR